MSEPPADLATLSARVSAIGDQQQIHSLLARYATAVDARDWNDYAACFTDDADIDYQSSGGPRGNAAAVVPWLRESMANFAMSSHYVTNIVITFGDTDAAASEIPASADHATGHALFYSPMGNVGADGTMDMLHVGGSYTDRYTRTAAGWRISARRQDTSWFSGGWTPPAETD